MQHELEFYSKRDAEKRKNDDEVEPLSSQGKKKKNAGGSRVVDVDSYDESDGSDTFKWYNF